MPPTSFNLAALLLFQPLTLMASPPKGTVAPYSAFGINAGRTKQSAVFQLTSNCLALRLPAYAALKDGADYPGLLKVLHNEGYEVDRTYYSRSLREFIHLQVEAVNQPTSPLGWAAVLAHDEFMLQTQRLESHLRPLFPLHKSGMRTLASHCWGLYKKSSGVFVWPDWRTPGAVFAVVNVEDDLSERTRALLNDWLAQEGLHMAPQPGF